MKHNIFKKIKKIKNYIDILIKHDINNIFNATYTVDLFCYDIRCCCVSFDFSPLSECCYYIEGYCTSLFWNKVEQASQFCYVLTETKHYFLLREVRVCYNLSLLNEDI